MSEPRTVSALLTLGERVLSMSTAIFDDHDKAHEARQLLAHCLDVPEEKLDEGSEPPRRIRERYLALIARRAAGEPFPFLTGFIEFFGLHLKVRPGAFVPRPSSELLVARAVKRLVRRRSPLAVDVCTGQGPIAVAIAAELPGTQVWGLDIDTEGLAQGRRNARELQVGNVKFRRGDLFAPLPAHLLGGIDVITAHVPYIAPHELVDLPAEVVEHEPAYTLTDDSVDGMDLMRRVVTESTEWLKAGGWLLLEIAEDLAPQVRRECRRAGLQDSGVASDEDGLSVVVEARRNL